MRLLSDVPLSPHTTFQIGGPADFFVEVSSVSELEEACRFAREKALPLFILGGGSNVLVSDAGWRGLAIKIAIGGIERKGSSVRAGAGVSWDELVAFTVGQELWGLENLSGIPGSVGGAVVQNIGAYGAAISEVFESAEVFDIESGTVRTFSREECAFDYRDSFFKHDGGKHVVLSASFMLSSAPKPNLSYRDLAERFAGMSPSLAEIREAVLSIRRGKFPDLSKEGTAGSFFKNPILPKAEAVALQSRYPEMPLFDMPETTGVKVPMGWILDKVLGLRGHAKGGARLFEKQALVIAAERGSSAEDVRALAAEVIERVREACGIELEPEVRIISHSK
ncbi:MAG TPA: UDP-N-acetylmuramate dehydrogenase [Candidatus Paceibacterota bacterium]|nr:UDP-N-acetylmuramate dehydrogenase [Candidatus Paceibacterota bacterium]